MGGKAMTHDSRNADYMREYETWVESLDPEEREKLKALNLDKPLPNDHRANGTGLSEDIADSPFTSYEPDMAELLDSAAADFPPSDNEANESTASTPADSSTTTAPDPDLIWDVMRRLIGEILDAPNRSLTTECLAAVSGMSYMGDSLTSIAKRHRVSRAAVSKRCVELTEKLALLPSRAMRTLTARNSYRHAQLNIRKSYEN